MEFALGLLHCLVDLCLLSCYFLSCPVLFLIGASVHLIVCIRVAAYLVNL